MFDTLQDRLASVFKGLRAKGRLTEADIDSFDSWAATLATTTAKMELNTAGDGYAEKVRMRGFTDAIGDGMRVWRSFADTKTIEDLPYLTRPKVKGGQRQVHVVPMSETQELVKATLRERVDAIPKGFKPKKGDENHLTVIGDGRAMAVSPALLSKRGLEWAGIDPDDPDAQDSPKLEKMADQITDIWAQHKDDRFKVRRGSDEDAELPGALQMVIGDTRRAAYVILKEKLVARGMDPSRIRISQDEDDKAKLYADARDGKVDVLFGSTQSLGTGVNVQNRLYALHHMDSNWKPSDIEQREGRILRQGNQYDEAEIHVYATENTHDVKTWDMVAYKQAGLDQLRVAGYDQKGIEFADDEDPMRDYDSISGDAAGNALIGERRDLEAQLKKMRKSAARHAQSIEAARVRSERLRYTAGAHRERAGTLRNLKSQWRDTRGEKFTMQVGDETFTDRAKANEKITEGLTKAFSGAGFPVGQQNASKSYSLPELHIGGFKAVPHQYRDHTQRKWIEYRFDETDAPSYREPNLPIPPVVFGQKDDLKGTTVTQKLENRVNSLDSLADREIENADLADGQAATLTDQMNRSFNGAQDLIDAERQMELLNKLLAEQGTPSELAQMRDEYERLKTAGVERVKAERAAKVAAARGREVDAEKAAEQVKMSVQEKEAEARALRQKVAEARKKKVEADNALRKAAGLEERKPSSGGSGSRSGGSGGGSGTRGPRSASPAGDGDKDREDLTPIDTDELAELGVNLPTTPDADRPRPDVTPDAATGDAPEDLTPVDTDELADLGVNLPTPDAARPRPDATPDRGESSRPRPDVTPAADAPAAPAKDRPKAPAAEKDEQEGSSPLKDADRTRFEKFIEDKAHTFNRLNNSREDVARYVSETFKNTEAGRG